MARRRRLKDQSLDALLRDWEFVPGEIGARLLTAEDGRQVIQLRVDMGVLQMETEHRPDGTRPGGAETYFDYLVGLAIHKGDDFELSEDQCSEVDREFLQFYQRRLCWLALREFRSAVRDADHNLGLMDFVSECSEDEEWIASHEQYRPFVLFHRTYAAAMGELEDAGPETAIDEVNKGLERIQQFFISYEAEESYEEDPLVEQLRAFRETLRERFGIGQTLREQLDHAIQTEQYELAAELRDRISRRPT